MFRPEYAFSWLLPLVALPLLAAGPAADTPVTYSKDVAPILYKNCTGCHRPNDIAPMSLLTYKDVRPWAASIRQAVVLRKMPPWYADPQFGHFANDPRLSDAAIATFTTWVKEGAKEGKPSGSPASARLQRRLEDGQTRQDRRHRPGLQNRKA